MTTTTSNIQPPVNQRNRLAFDDAGGSRIRPNQTMVVLEASGSAFPTSTAVLDASWSFAVILWAVAFNPTTRESYQLPHDTGDGFTGCRINGANLEVSTVGSAHDWTDFDLYVRLEYVD